MLTLDVLENIKLSRRPIGQLVFASLMLTPNYNFPLTRTQIELEGEENLPFGEPAFIAMNHTDRYNYWPFQYRIWRDHSMYTTVWVKGKYYNTRAMQRFMVATANLPVPSRGYIITADHVALLGRPPSETVYRLLRNALDVGETSTLAVREQAAEAGVLTDIVTLFDTPREMLGMAFRPSSKNYLETVAELFDVMMERFVSLSQQAFDLGLSTIVFPEGTRATRLQRGHTGLAQLALRMGASIIPVGSNNSDLAYPGDSPLSRGGCITYRVGAPLRPDGDLARFQISEPFRPFTPEAEQTHRESFRAVTNLVMDRINELLDERHQRVEGVGEGTTGSDRFL